jgi:hypothetical protein
MPLVDQSFPTPSFEWSLYHCLYDNLNLFCDSNTANSVETHLITTFSEIWGDGYDPEPKRASKDCEQNIDILHLFRPAETS